MRLGKWPTQRGRKPVPAFVIENINSLRDLRREKGLSLAKLSDACKIPGDSIARYERGEYSPTREKYNMLAEYFGWQKWEA